VAPSLNLELQFVDLVLSLSRNSRESQGTATPTLITPQSKYTAMKCLELRLCLSLIDIAVVLLNFFQDVLHYFY